MKNDYDSLNEGTRSGQRAKRKKTNLILNSLIVIVILLIGIVSFNIFFSNDEGAADQNDIAADKDQAASSPKKKEDNKGAASKDDKDSEKNPEENSDSEASEEESADEQSDPIVTEGGSDANVKQTIENPEWKPVGTTQSGEHTPVFDQNAVDWQEMILAYSYATGIDQNNMTVWWNQRGSEPNSAVGTISEKGSDQTFRVSIQWVDGEGWKPVRVEELIKNDKR
ncbi:YrrS family protein [Mesobacillus thioparans]|uniref:YrrS family protein n=1 Tax=Mesobacillus thioparans TaxID=370439 RepID=UPI0039EFB816